jgi:CRISPR-associated protein Cas5d
MNRTIDDTFSVQMEVAGPLAMFTRPDTGGTPTSYPLPTFSAAKGLFESIAFFSDARAWICPTKAEVCRRMGEAGGRVRFQQYTNNYGGPLRKDKLLVTGALGGGSSMQLHATVLSEVCYRLHGLILGVRTSGPTNPRHHLMDLFARRLKRGQCFRTPCLGWSEFTCSYWGPFREGVTEVDAALNLRIPSMLTAVWDAPEHGEYQPSFGQNIVIQAGVLLYDAPPEWRGNAKQRGAANVE